MERIYEQRLSACMTLQQLCALFLLSCISNEHLPKPTFLTIKMPWSYVLCVNMTLVHIIKAKVS